jgi:hypothetical protein
MRATIRPVSLSRIAEVTDICFNQDISKEGLEEALQASSKRVDEIIAEMARIGLINQENRLELTAQGRHLHDSLENENWDSVHEVFNEDSPHYRVFVDSLRQHTEDEGLTEEDIIDRLNDSHDSLKFNATGISLLTDWAERLGVIQQNVFQGRYYWVSEDFEGSFTQTLQKQYSEMEVERGVNLRQRYISIPKLREAVCEDLRIPRAEFDELLGRIYLDNIGNMELSGAPLNTQAKETSVGIKTIEKDESGSITTTKISSDQILDGVTLEDGKMYYYVSLFNELNGDV